MKTFLLALAAITILGAPVSAQNNGKPTMFNSKESCEAALLSGNFVAYEPTYKGLHDRNLPDGKNTVAAGMESDSCVHAFTIHGWNWVVLMKGTMLRWNVNEDKTLGKPYAIDVCGNPVDDISNPNPPVQIAQSTVGGGIARLDINIRQDQKQEQVSRDQAPQPIPQQVVYQQSSCESGANFDSRTGMPCSGPTYPAGCSSGQGFSVTTGMPCSGQQVVATPKRACWFSRSTGVCETGKGAFWATIGALACKKGILCPKGGSGGGHSSGTNGPAY